MTEETVSRTDWSRVIAEVLFGKRDSGILVTSKAELESLIIQAKENKATARILSKTEAREPEARALLETAREEAQNRLRDAVKLLSQTQKICQEEGVPYTVIKSLDAVPDIGHDVDLLVGKNLTRVRSELLRQFHCDPVTLTFCDRHAGKFSTFIQGFDSDFELYTRISQLGEEYYPEERVLARRGEENVFGSKTYLCSQEDRLLITCIHTLYRHGKIRLSDLKVARDALSSRLDSSLVFHTVDSSGIQAGFAVFLAILNRMGREILEEDVVPNQFKEYSDRILQRDRVMGLLSRHVSTRFPLKMPVGLVALLFLYKAAADLAHRRLGSSLRSVLAPALLIIDKAVPLKVQKAISVRVW